MEETSNINNDITISNNNIDNKFDSESVEESIANETARSAVATVSCELSEFSRPTTPPPSTPSPSQQISLTIKPNVNKRKIKMHSTSNLSQYGEKKLNNLMNLDADDSADENFESECINQEQLDNEDIDDEFESKQAEQEQLDEQQQSHQELAAEENNDELMIDESNNNNNKNINNNIDNKIINNFSETELDSNNEFTDENINNNKLSQNKDLAELNTKLTNNETDNDLIVCGKCQTSFKLSDIMMFIQHKVNKCLPFALGFYFFNFIIKMFKV
jgi:hypothetical protein